MVLLCAVLLVAGVVLEHKARRSALFAIPPGEVASGHVERGVSDGPVYPVGADSVGAAAPRRRYGMLSSDEQEDSVLQSMRQYAALHPVYHRCAKQADLSAFNTAITKSCGNVHELATCSHSCTSAMNEWSSKMGCCFETVLDAYKVADPAVEHAWRMWQGTMSGKCGVTFETNNCGESMGEHEFHALESDVQSIKKTAAQNQDDIQYMANAAYYNNQYYSGQNSYDAWGQNNYDPYYYDPYYNNPGAYDDYYDSTDFYGDNSYNLDPERYADRYYYTQDTMVPPTHYKGNGRQSMTIAGHSPSNGKLGLGDEVMDLPSSHPEDMGDVHVPAGKLSPYMYSHGQHMKAPGPSATWGGFKGATESLAAVKPQMQQLSANAYDDSINYKNSLRIKEAMRGKAPPTDSTMPRFGDSWQGSAFGSMSKEIAGIAPPTPGESWLWQGKDASGLESLEQMPRITSLFRTPRRGVLPAELPFQARNEEQKASASSYEADGEFGEEGGGMQGNRLSEEEGVVFPMARGVLIGGDGSVLVYCVCVCLCVCVHVCVCVCVCLCVCVCIYYIRTCARPHTHTQEHT